MNKIFKEKIKVGIHGSSGKMGKELIKLESKYENIELSYLYSRKSKNNSIDDLCKASDVIIDFSSREGAVNLVEHAKNYKNIKLVICSTGFKSKDLQIMKEIAGEIPILLTPNTSIGVNFMKNSACLLAKKLADQNMDIDILDIHHNKKKDAPSGTALMIAESICAELPEYKISIMKPDKLREKKQIIITSIRSGNVFGTHEIIFACENENITITHKALNKEIFAKGAFDASIWLSNKSPGKLYSMQDVLESE